MCTKCVQVLYLDSICPNRLGCRLVLPTKPARTTTNPETTASVHDAGIGDRLHDLQPLEKNYIDSKSSFAENFQQRKFVATLETCIDATERNSFKPKLEPEKNLKYFEKENKLERKQETLLIIQRRICRSCTSMGGSEVKSRSQCVD